VRAYVCITHKLGIRVIQKHVTQDWLAHTLSYKTPKQRRRLADLGAKPISVIKHSDAKVKLFKQQFQPVSVNISATSRCHSNRFLDINDACNTTALSAHWISLEESQPNMSTSTECREVFQCFVCLPDRHPITIFLLQAEKCIAFACMRISSSRPFHYLSNLLLHVR